MAYADSIRSAEYTREELADLVDNLRVDHAWSGSGSNLSTTSASLISTGRTFSLTHTSDDLVYIWFLVYAGSSGTNGILAFNVAINAGGAYLFSEDVWAQSGSGGAAGPRESLMIGAYTTSSVGTNTYTLEYKSYGGDTAWIWYSGLGGFVMKQR